MPTPDVLGESPAGVAASSAGVAAPLQTLRWVLLAALVFFLAHLPFLAPTLDDIDAVNFAFGVRSFDPAEHHPHPPGYPVYVALGKVSTGVLRALRSPGGSQPLVHDQAATALAFWSALFGAFGVVAWYVVFLELGALGVDGEGSRRGPPGLGPSSTAGWASLLAAAAPLIWFSASRPMSDVPGVVAATAAQALLLGAWRRESRAGAGDDAAHGGRAWLIAGALIAGLAVGIRSQALWLTLPLLAAAVVARARRLRPAAGLAALGAYLAALLAWAIPMLVASGGWRRYYAALQGQGVEDFAGVDMLWTHPGIGRLLKGLAHTFVLPWSSAALAAVVLVLALWGTIRLFRRAPWSLALLGLLALPYAAFHTLFQETVTTRYALPLVPAVCYLAVHGAIALGRRLSVAVLAIVVAWSLVLTVPSVRAYSSTPAPVFRALHDMQARTAKTGRAGVLGMHRRVATESRPAFAWADVAPWSRRLPSPRHLEWAEARSVLLDEPSTPVWFLAEPARTGELLYRDLALIDPRARRLVGHYGWGFETTALVGGARPDTMDLYEIDAPGWIAGEGWALTPETAGLAARARRGPSYGGIQALVRRRPGQAILAIGGRHLGTPADGPARIDVQIDNRRLADFVVPVQPRFFAKMIPVPAGLLSGAGPFAMLSVRAAAPDGGNRVVPASIEQFDLQDATGVVFAFDEGWQEPEYDPSRQSIWRWMSERATLWVHAGSPGPLTLRVSGESPRKYFDRPASLRVVLGGRELARLAPEAWMPRLLARALGGQPFSIEVVVEAGELAAASNRITLEADQFFVPAAAGVNADRRHLSARISEVTITPRH